MGKLTTFSRFLITLAIIAGLYFLITKFLLPKFGGGSTNNTEVSNSNTTAEDNNASSNSNNSNASSGSNSGGSAVSGGSTFKGGTFGFQPPAPGAGAKKQAIVELGATGFNSFIVTVDKQKNWKLEKAEYGASLVNEGMATSSDVSQQLRSYIANILAYGVSPKEIHFVVSSGATKEASTQTIISALKKMNYFVNTVTPEQEGSYALKAAMPRDFDGNAFVVDIGSGNTKISWVKNGNVTAVECAGAKYFQKNMTDASVYADVKSKASLVPSAMRTTCFIIGGIPFELAKKSRNGKDRYTVLNSANSYVADGDKQRCGLNIYKAIADATKCEQFVFDWDANFSIGFLLGMK